LRGTIKEHRPPREFVFESAFGLEIGYIVGTDRINQSRTDTLPPALAGHYKRRERHRLFGDGFDGRDGNDLPKNRPGAARL